MGILFISHAAQDNSQALKVRDWLNRNGWNDIYLDIDPERGAAPGQHWGDDLNRVVERCAGTLILISPSWAESRWCQAEFLASKLMGKKIFPLFVAPTSLDQVPAELRATFQIADISTPEREAEGFERLAIGLKRAGLDPKSFGWPPAGDPHRPIYRGLQSLEEQDAAIFFGRDALITKGLDALRRMRDGAPERVLVILGASGAGKSSFLKAGLIARLKRDQENFVVLPVIRPERSALTGVRGLAASLGREPSQLNSPECVAEALMDLRSPIIEQLRHFADLAHNGRSVPSPTIVIPIDQAEELFAAENIEATQALEMLASALRVDENVIIIATIRSDTFENLQNERRFTDIDSLPFSLPGIPQGAFKEVIEGPARLSNPPLMIEPALTDRLLQDLAAADALPLLAFTLERLSLRHRYGGTITLAEYVEELGGVQGAISAAVEAAFAQAQRDPSLPRDRVELEKLARAAFIPALVQLDDADGEPMRRVERLNALPKATLPLVRHLIDQRLLVSHRGTIAGAETDAIEVAHEAILRQWRGLSAWIAEERDALRTLAGVRIAAAEWRKHKAQEQSRQGTSWLTHKGGRLEEAEALITRPGFANALNAGEVEYLAACRASENAERLREKTEIARTRRLQRNIGFLIAMAAGAVLLGTAGILQLLAGVAARTSDTLASLAVKEATAGDYDSAARYAVAGLAGADWPLLGYRGGTVQAELVGAASASRALAVLRGGGSIVANAAFSPDGTRIVTALGDRTVRIWDVKTQRQIAVLRGHGGAVESAAFSPDGRRIVTASQDGTARIWDARTARCLGILRGHNGVVMTAVYSQDGTHIVTASFDKTARIWDARSAQQLAVLRGHDGVVESAAFSPDGLRVVTASADKSAGIWDSTTARQIAALRGHDDVVDSALFSPDGSRIVTASADKTARIWDASSFREIAVLRGHQDVVESAAFSADSARIVTASADTTARLWDVGTAREIALLRGHEGTVNSAVFSPDSARIVTASDDATVRIWAASTASALAILGHDDAVLSAAFSPDGRLVITTSEDGTARLWDAGNVHEVALLRGHEGAVISAAFSPDGSRIATASEDRTVRLWNAKTAHAIAVLRGHKDIVHSAAFSPDGTRLVSASDDKTARVWDTATAREITVLSGHKDVVNAARFSPDGTRIITTSYDRTARIWQAGSARQVAVLRGLFDGAVFSPDGTRILTAGHANAQVWDAKSMRMISALRGHEGRVVNAAFSFDGTRIVTASWDRTARIWDTKTSQTIAVLRGHDGTVWSASFSPDGKRVITASRDRSARIWNVSNWLSVPRSALVRRICESTLANGLSRFSEQELRAAPVLDPKLDTDACHPPSLWARLGRIFSAALPQ